MNPTAPFHHVSRETIEEHKELYFALLSKWNQKINLIQEESLNDFEERHWKDSVQLLDHIKDPSLTILDIGSGGGFPGIPLAIHGFYITMSEIIDKKRIFLKEVIRQCNLTNANTTSDAFQIKEKYDVVVSRAFSSLKNILSIHLNVSRETTRGFYLKGETFQEELHDALKLFSFNFIIHPSKTSKDSVILEIFNLSKK